MSRSPRIPVAFDDETYKQIKAYAHKENKSMSELIREWTYQGLNGSVSKSNISLITEIIDERLLAILNPKVERLAALSAKTCVMSATSAYLNAETLSKFVPDDVQMDYQEAYIKARKKAIEYTKGRVDNNEIDE